MRHLICIALLTLISSAALPAHAVIIDNQTSGTGNTTAPVDDPGWVHIGTRNSLSVVYIGNGWVISASHVGIGSVELDGIVYPSISGSRISMVSEISSLMAPGSMPDFEMTFKIS